MTDITPVQLLPVFATLIGSGATVFVTWVKRELRRLDEIPRLKAAIRVMAQVICNQVARDHPGSEDNLESIVDKILAGENDK